MTEPVIVEVRDNVKVEIRDNTARVEFRESGPPGMKGDKGDKGDPGPPSIGSEQIWQQNTPVATWNITHTLGGYPTVVILDSANSVQQGDINYPDTSHITVTFGAPFSGRAVLNV